MYMQTLFWAIMIFWALCGWGMRNEAWKDRAVVGGNVGLFVLLALLGWKVFGAAIQG